MTTSPPLNGPWSTNAEVSEADRTRVFHSWSAQAHIDPIPLVSGEGVTLRDAEGGEYLDFSSQLVNANMGYGHPVIAGAIRQQASFPTIDPKHASPVRAEAARLVLERAPEGFEKIFFTNGGADAVENAIRMARLHTGRDKIVSRYRSYHGNTGAAINATGDWRRIPNEFARGHVHVFGPYLYRTQFHAETPEQECERALAHLESTVRAEGPETIAAILLESIPGTAGIMVPPPGYLAGAREIADRYGILLILDEVMAGFARTGHWLALDAHDVVPDLITFAKGVNSGYVPAGGVMISSKIAHTFDDRVFPGGLTYSGHPLAMASIVGNLTAMADEGVVENAAAIGRDVIGPALERMAGAYDVVGEVRGLGCFWAMELVSDPDTRTPLDGAAMGRLKADLLGRGLLPFVAENRIHVVPPCVIAPDDARRGLDIIDQSLAAFSG